jgi:6-phosphogluconate dehydrogenase
LVEKVKHALYASKIISYAQGFALLKAAAKQYGWELDFESIAKIFRGGCIIRAKFLNRIAEAYAKDPTLENLLLDGYFTKTVAEVQEDWRDVVSLSIVNGIPVSAFAAAISYYDAFRSLRYHTNLIQAQRDYFGAHTYQRVDREGFFHHEFTESDHE